MFRFRRTNVVRGMPMAIEQPFALLPSRFDPVWATNVTMTVGFELLDTGLHDTFYIRRQVGEMAAERAVAADLTIRATKRDLGRLFFAGEVPPSQREFWRKLEFAVPAQGLLTPLERLRKLAMLSRLF